jgi:ribosomal protein L11 methylase PrmA
MDRPEDIAGTARFFDRAISEFMVCRRPPPIRVLDFGCGSGDLVAGLTDLGYDAYGCDVTLDMTANDRRFRQIDSARLSNSLQ